MNYPVYYNNVVDINDEYNGWRILSINEENNEIQLVTAGIPILYSHSTKDISTSMKKLTIDIFENDIGEKSFFFVK